MSSPLSSRSRKPRCCTREGALTRLARVASFRFRKDIQIGGSKETKMLIHSFCLFNSFSASDILDIKPANMEELTEVITAAEFHPTSCNLFCYSSSKGTVKLADMRDSALCDRHAKSGSSSPLILQVLCSSNTHSKLTEPLPTTSPILLCSFHNSRYPLQCMKKKKIHRTNPSLAKSSPPFPTSNSQETVVTSYQEIT